MSAKTFVEYAAGYGVVVTQDLSNQLHAAWKSSWREMLEYFQYIKQEIQFPDSVTGVTSIQQLYSGRYRGDVNFTAAANTLFQGLAADGAKDALWEVTKECFDPKSLMYGSHPVLFLHDEIGTEVPISTSSAAAHRQAEIMINTMKKWVPSIPITAKPILCKRWYKGAKPVYDSSGNLLPSKPVTEGKKIIWVADTDEETTCISPNAPTAITQETNIKTVAQAHQ